MEIDDAVAPNNAMNSRRLIIYSAGLTARSQSVAIKASISVKVAQAEILLGLVANPRRRLDQAAAMTAPDRPDPQRDDQPAADHRQHPVIFADPGVMRDPGILMQ